MDGRPPSAGIIACRRAEFLPGRLWIENGRSADYTALARFHYLNARPATWAGVWVAIYSAAAGRRVVGVAVLSWPAALHAGRNRVFGLNELPYGRRIAWANENVRTISRVIVHPQFRALGLAGDLIRAAIAGCPTRYVEASARMAHAHPMFKRAGMTRLADFDLTRPAYFHHDRQRTVC